MSAEWSENNWSKRPRRFPFPKPDSKMTLLLVSRPIFVAAAGRACSVSVAVSFGATSGTVGSSDDGMVPGAEFGSGDVASTSVQLPASGGNWVSSLESFSSGVVDSSGSRLRLVSVSAGEKSSSSSSSKSRGFVNSSPSRLYTPSLV